MILSAILLNKKISDEQVICDCDKNPDCVTCKQVYTEMPYTTTAIPYTTTAIPYTDTNTTIVYNKDASPIPIGLVILVFIIELLLLFYALKLSMSCKTTVKKFFNFLFALINPLLYIIVRLLFFTEC